jgi:TatD DNase family protein
MNSVIPYVNIHSHHSGESETFTVFNAGADPEALTKHDLLSIGIHPWHIRQFDIGSALDFIEKNVTSEKVFAIGECGLDKLIDIPLEEQKDIFIKQIRIAEKYNKPMIIHCVKAFDELIRIKKEQSITVPLIVHGFNNNGQIAKQLIDNGFYLSFGKALMKEWSNAQNVIKQINEEHFFLETDDGNTSIKSIFDKVSSLKNIGMKTLKKKMIMNFNKLKNNG